MAKEWTPMKLNKVFLTTWLVILALGAGLFANAAASPLGDILSPLPFWDDYPDWLGFPLQTGSLYGYAVAAAGDLDCDGYADIAVGASKFNNLQEREGAVFVYYGAQSDMSGTPDWIYTSGFAGSLFGSAVSSAGDVNNDGCDDLVVGAHRYKNGEAGEGIAYLFLGSSSGLSTTPAWTYESNVKEAQFGYAVSSAGDVNFDGYDDVLIGANTLSPGLTNQGAAFLFYGNEDGLNTSPAWSYIGEQDFANLGSAVSHAGSVNGDNYDDVLIGAPFFNDTYTDEGMVLVFHGSASGLSLVPDQSLYMPADGAWFGHAVSSAGDVNHDGFDDIVIGAPMFTGSDGIHEHEGAAFVYHGSPSGIPDDPNWEYASDQIWANLGWSVSGAGDVNDDSFDDLIVGAPMYEYDQPDEGAAFVFRGSLGGLISWPEWTGQGNQASTQFGWSVSTAGDANNDGCDDVVIGAPEFMKDEKTKMGRAFLYIGLENLQAPQFTVHLPMVIRNP